MFLPLQGTRYCLINPLFHMTNLVSMTDDEADVFAPL